jgi:prophage tail gpP-like protein
LYPIKNVQTAIASLTSGKLGQGYIQLDPNQDLYNILPTTIIDLQTEVSLPKYFVDQNAHSLLELQAGAAMAMAEIQDKYFVLNYTVQGLTQSGFVWYPNQMCNVYDEITGGTSAIDGPYWIKKVNFTVDRASGYHTHIELTLPYTHLFDVTLQ